ncbi:hypothetical protein D3C87_1476910 [compost metagenome]
MPRRQCTALDVELAAVDRAKRRIKPETGFAVLGIFPGLQGAQHLRGEGFVDFVVVEVLQGQAIAREQARYGVDRRHQQPFGTVDEIHRRRLTVTPVGQNR